MSPTWDDFKRKHILNPMNHRGNESWDKREQNNWLKNRLAGFRGNQEQEYGRKNINSVIIATSQEVLEDFRSPGVKFEAKDDFHWSNHKYPIWLFNKRREEGDEQYSVTKLNLRHGPMHFLARTTPQDGYKPIHFHAQSPKTDSRSFPRYVENESFHTEIQQIIEELKQRQQQADTKSSFSGGSLQSSAKTHPPPPGGRILASPPPPQASTSTSLSIILQTIANSLHTCLLKPLISFGNFILNEVILKVFFIKKSR